MNECTRTIALLVHSCNVVVIGGYRGLIEGFLHTGPLGWCHRRPPLQISRSLIPEFSVSSAESEPSPSRALVMLPSGEVLLGIKVQQKVPNILHTPRFSASNISKVILFCHAIREVGPICSAMPCRCNLSNQPPEKKRFKVWSYLISSFKLIWDSSEPQCYPGTLCCQRNLQAQSNTRDVTAFPERVCDPRP